MSTTYTLRPTDRDTSALDRRLAKSAAYEQALLSVVCERLADDFLPVDPDTAAAWLAQHGVAIGSEAQLVEGPEGRLVFAAYELGEDGRTDGLRCWAVLTGKEITADAALQAIESQL